MNRYFPAIAFLLVFLLAAPMAFATDPPEGAVLGPTPLSLTIEVSPGTSVILGETAQLTVTAEFDDASMEDVTQASTGTTYMSTDEEIFSVDADGGVTALQFGTAEIIVMFPGPEMSFASGTVELTATVEGDSDGDGMPDDFELKNGLDPDDPSDGDLDNDEDTLTNREEYVLGTDPNNNNTDDDGSPDGEEVAVGTDPLTFDVDRDPIIITTLNENCTVSILNRTVRVNPDGSFVVNNLPSSGMIVQVRAVCELDGLLLGGFSEPFELTPGALTEIGDIPLGPIPPTVESLTVFPDSSTLFEVGETTQINVTATLSDGNFEERTSMDFGTTFTSSNPFIVTVDTEGVVAATGDGTAIISVVNEGVFASTRVMVFAGEDDDGDGIPNDYEEANGLDPDDFTDAGQDPDNDGLTNLDEFNLGTDPNISDTDGDGLDDGAEGGADPLLPDSDLDGLLDGQEVNVFGSDPTNPDSDFDGLSDGLEVALSGDPTSAVPFGDDDGDSLTNIDEVTVHGTDPTLLDTDGDGATDGEEILIGSDPLVADTIPPTVMLLEPLEGTDLVKGDSITVMAEADDNVRVTRVDLFIDDILVDTDTESPFEIPFTVPLDIDSTTIEVVAVDTNNNMGSTGQLSFDVIEDPLTIVEGMVVDEMNVPVDGAFVFVPVPNLTAETGMFAASSDSVSVDTVTGITTANMSGMMTFDPGTMPVFGHLIDLDATEDMSLTGTWDLDLSGFDPFSPTAVPATLTLDGTTPSGMTLSLDFQSITLTPQQGIQPFSFALDVTAFNAGGLQSAMGLEGKNLILQVDGSATWDFDFGIPELLSVGIDSAATYELVVVSDFSTVTDSSGMFSIPDVPTIFGDVIVRAEDETIDGSKLRGRSDPVPPVRDGTTDVGIIVLRAGLEGALIASYDATRVGESRHLLNESVHGTLRAALEEAGATIIEIPTLSAENLDGVDIFFPGLHNGSITTDEQNALVEFINNGGGMVSFTENSCCNFNLDQINNLFGLTTLGTGPGNTTTIVLPDHPVADGPFGVVDNDQNQYLPNSPGAFDLDQLPQGTEVIATTNTGEAAIIALEGGQGLPASSSGSMVLFNDVNFIGDTFSDTLSASPGNLSAIMNAFDFASR